jgi:hypothetical protein
VAERIPLVPVLRRKLLNVPLGLDQPYWIDDPDFDIEYHVRELHARRARAAGRGRRKRAADQTEP